MTFFNHFTSININISNFCSGFGGIFPPCFRNFAFTSSPWLTGFNFGMSLFNNFSMFGGFTNYSSLNNMPMTSLWNLNSTNINPPNFNNFSWNTANYNSFNYNFTTPSFGMCNFDTFTCSKSAGKKICNISKEIPSNYDKTKGKKLAQIALKNQNGFNGLCATYVKKAIEKAGLGSYVNGDAYQMNSILRKNKNFKEISPSSVNVKDLPAGCVLVYDKGVEGYNKLYGHTEITTGDGRAVSDGITKNLHKKPSAIFVPVTA